MRYDGYFDLSMQFRISNEWIDKKLGNIGENFLAQNFPEDIDYWLGEDRESSKLPAEKKDDNE